MKSYPPPPNRFRVKSSFSFLRQLEFCPEFFGRVEKRLDTKVIRLIINNNNAHNYNKQNNYNAHIVQYLKKQRQSDNLNQEIWSGNRLLLHEKYFSRKVIPKCYGKTSPRPFSKKSKLSISSDQQPEILYILLLLYVLVEDYENMLKLRC